MTSLRCAALLLLLASANERALEAQANWCSYRIGTMRAVMEQHRENIVPDLPADNHNFIHNTRPWPFRTSVTYLSTTRLLPPFDSMFLDAHLRDVVHDTAFRARFHRQALFVEGADTLWLPIQDSLIPGLAGEATRGDTVTLFVRWLGAHQEGPRATWVFIVNEFATARSQADWDRTLSACGARGDRQTADPPGTLASISETRAVYDSGFARIANALPPGASRETSPLWPLWAIARFRLEAVGWAALEGERYVSAHTGPHPRAWLVVVPTETPAYGRMRGPLQIDPTTDLIVAQIAPEHVTMPWAGVFLAHYLSLLADYALGATARGRSTSAFYVSEARAYQIELMAADLVSAGAFRRTLDSVLAQASVRTADDLFQQLNDLYAAALTATRTLVSAEPPRSHDEETLRNGFVLVALVTRYCELKGIEPTAAGPLYERLEASLRVGRPD